MLLFVSVRELTSRNNASRRWRANRFPWAVRAWRADLRAANRDAVSPS
jgi:hypothetical protein